jgi:hypothetical protein
MRLALIALLLVGCTAAAPTPAPTPQTHHLTGTFTLNQHDPVVRYQGNQCNGTGGYDDIKPGLPVTVKDGAGAIIGLGALVSSQAAPVYTDDRQCVYSFEVTVPDVPFYSVEVGHRGAVAKSRADVEAQGWTVAVTLGG